MLKVLAAVGAVVVVVLGVGAYLLGSAAVAAGKAQSDANAAMETARTHINDTDASLKAAPTFDVSGNPPDFAKAKKAVDDLVAGLGDARTTDARDEAGLRSVRDDLSSKGASPFALPYRGALDHEHQRVVSMLTALDAADGALKIVQDQLRILSAAFDADMDFVTLLDRIQKEDIAGGLALFPSIDAKLQAAAKLAQGPAIPPQLQKELKDMQTTSTDLNAFLRAVQARDSGTIQALTPRLDADVAALDSLDITGLETYEQTLIQPYRDRYDAAVKAAGYTLKT